MNKDYFTGLIANVLKMADKLVDFELDIKNTPFQLDIDTQLSRPEGIALDDLNLVHLDPVTGTLNYQGKNIVLYIPDHSYGDTFEQVMSGNLNAGKKFHLTFCSVLEKMKANGRYERYHINNNEEQLFQIVDKLGNTSITPLLVCIPCLTQLNYQNYNHSRNNQHKIRKEFRFKEFLEIYTTNFNELPHYVGQDKGGYTSDWVSISTLYRASKNYTCESCGVNLNSRKGLLHTHHKNGVTHDNRPSNLKAVCVLCHYEEPNHAHMSALAEQARADILKLRQAQGLI